MVKDHGLLYVMVFVAMLNSCNTSIRTREIKEQNSTLSTKLTNLEYRLGGIETKQNAPLVSELKAENDHQFFEVNGQRAYIKINSKPAQFYTTNISELEAK